MARKSLNAKTSARVLMLSRRRCCLCLFLDHRDEACKGQIAHLNRDPSDGRFDNLVWLCLKHHDDYDSRTSQSKGLTELELRTWRDRLAMQFEGPDSTWCEASADRAGQGEREPSEAVVNLRDMVADGSRFAFARLVYDAGANAFSVLDIGNLKRAISRRTQNWIAFTPYDQEIICYFRSASPGAKVDFSVDHHGGHTYHVVDQNDFWVRIRPLMTAVRLGPLESHEVLIEFRR